MGGKTNTTTQQVQIPQNVLARYDQVNSQAQEAATQPFKSYSSDPNAFVAPLTDSQNAGIAGTNAAAGMAQPFFNAATSQLHDAQSSSTPYYGQATDNLNAAGQTIGGLGSTLQGARGYNAAATGLALQGAQGVNPTDLDASSIGKYMNPYLSTVLGSTSSLLDQDNAKAMNGTLGNIIRGGGFGGDRAGIAAANLNQQQTLANANVYSGILNNAYTNALSTAQQQQGVGLSAAQANRAALQGASGQIQGLGQQFYDQGTGTEGLQFQQQTGLAGAQQGLGQAIYAQGANTSQQLAGLGAGSQAAALQGAQAQMAAGQQQQQTEQAGKSALYNQFLMQQSYPFQVSQFLANIAEGTGALSGQTVTTTQPGSMLSDERAKENKRLVGFTFDHQPIFVYNYKGDDTTHMGLMAQEVEKRHPGAVGEAAGLKTVNYDQATADAAHRGHFKKGGLVPYRGYAYGGAPTGFDPALAASMLQNGQGMFGPYLTGQGGPAASGTGPYGAGARVPSANLPVASLKSPDLHVQAQDGGLGQANHAADQMTSFVSNVEKGADWIKGKLPANDDSESALTRDLKSSSGDTDWGDGPQLRRGGRARFADGGMPYQGGLALQIPDDDSEHDHHLPSPPPLPGKGGASTSGDVKDIADTAADVAKIAAMFMRRGGFAEARSGYADGGAPNFDETGATFGDDFGKRPTNQTSGISPNFDETGLAQDKTNLVDAKAAKTPQEYRAAILHNAAQSAQTPEEYGAILRASSDSPPTHAAHRRAAPVQRPGMAGANGPWVATKPEDAVIGPDPSVAAPAPALGAMDLDGTLPDLHVAGGQGTSADAADGAPKDHHAVLSNIVDRVAPQGSYLDRLFHGDKMAILPFLSALGAATGARTSNPLTAIAQGLAAGAKSYQDLSVQQPEIDLHKQQVERAKVDTERAAIGAQQDIQQHAPAGTVVVPGFDPAGKGFMVNGKPYHYELQVNATNFGGPKSGVPTTGGAGAGEPIKSVVAAQGPSADTDKLMAETYHMDPSQPGTANRMRMLAQNGALAPQEEADEKRAQERIGNLGEADQTHRQLIQSADAISRMSKGTLTGQGYNSAYRAQLTNVYTTLRGMMGLGEDAAATQDLTAHQVSEKIRQLSGAAMAHQYGERAASVAHSISNVLPSGDLTPDAAGHILSQMLVANQQQRDFANYHTNYVARYGTGLNVEPAFQRDAGRVYDQEQQALSRVFKAGQMDTILGYLNNNDPATREAAVAKIDQKFGPGFHRYFTGGQ